MEEQLKSIIDEQGNLIGKQVKGLILDLAVSNTNSAALRAKVADLETKLAAAHEELQLLRVVNVEKENN